MGRNQTQQQLIPLCCWNTDLLDFTCWAAEDQQIKVKLMDGMSLYQRDLWPDFYQSFM